MSNHHSRLDNSTAEKICQKFKNQHFKNPVSTVFLHIGTYIMCRCQNCVPKNCEFCAPFLRILRYISTRFFCGTIVCDTGVLSRVSWLVNPLKLRVTVQFELKKVLEVIYQQRLCSSAYGALQICL